MSKKYRVVKSDSLWGLAERFYGDGRLYRVIGDHIMLGQKLEIPTSRFGIGSSPATRKRSWLSTITTTRR